MILGDFCSFLPGGIGLDCVRKLAGTGCQLSGLRVQPLKVEQGFGGGLGRVVSEEGLG